LVYDILAYKFGMSLVLTLKKSLLCETQFDNLWLGLQVYRSFNWVQIILAVGTKLQVTLSKMAIEIKERHAVVQGMPLVQGSDKYFWFGKPQLLLHLIHFALFQVFQFFK